MKKCGKNVRISKGCNLQGNIECGDNITIGVGAYFVSTGATICTVARILLVVQDEKEIGYGKCSDYYV